MEIAVDDALPSYSGGLGVFAGDFLRSAADLGLPVVGVTLLYHDGYFRQQLDPEGTQTEAPVRWSPEDRLAPPAPPGRRHRVRPPGPVAAWGLELIGVPGHHVPLYFLDTRLAENDPWDQGITDRLYLGDLSHRLCQEGGARPRRGPRCWPPWATATSGPST